MGRRLNDLTGQRFGRLIAIEHPYKRNAWHCRCDCGREKFVSGFALRQGTTQSCGCLNSELAAARKRTHGMTRTPTYTSWNAAKMRCTNPSDKRWSDYGGRGIRMCDDWLHDFQAFLRDVGPRPSLQHSLDRYPDNDGHYEPGNVRWATRQQQANNSRQNQVVTWRGDAKTIAEWAEYTGLSYYIIYLRIVRDGWSIERALTTPVAPNGGRFAIGHT